MVAQSVGMLVILLIIVGSNPTITINTKKNKIGEMNMNEDWKNELKKDMEEYSNNNMYKILEIGKNAVVIDISTKEKITKIIDGKQKTYITFKLLNNDKYNQISFTNYQYAMLLKELQTLEDIPQVIELIADVKTANNKRIYTFLINKKE